MPNDPPDLRQEILSAFRDEKGFLRLTLSAPASGGEWERIAVRPVAVRSERHLQVGSYAGKKHVSRNVPPAEFEALADSLLAMGFTQLNVQATSGDLHVRITRKGKVLMTRGKPSRPEAAPRLEHDHVKSYPLPVDKPDAFLREIGIQSADGKVKAPMFAKFRQINEFIRVIEQVVGGEMQPMGTDPVVGGLSPSGENRDRPQTTGSVPICPVPVFLVDCGCGNAYLTFAAFHYLRHVLGLNAHAVGVDVNPDLIAHCRRLRDKLGWAELDFHVSAIADYAPSRPPQIVVSLHACDTATDEALVRGVQWGSQAILAAPCCQHELHHALDHEAFRPALRHGLLRERLADIVTDSLRAAALRVMGYHARVFEFISPEHTSKNLMIAAEKIAGPDPGQPAAAKEYLALKQFWNVTPFIEKALGEPFQRVLAASMTLTSSGPNP